MSGLFLLAHVFFAHADGQPIVAGAQAGMVRGRVTLDDGRPAAGFRVVARTSPARPHNDAEAVTDSDGRYVLPLASQQPFIGFFSGPHGLHAGQFGILVDTGDGPYLETPPQIVTLPSSTTTPAKPAAFAADFVLHLGPPVTVRVRDAETGRPIADVPVEMAANLFSAGWHPVGRTDGRGELQLRISRLDADLRVDFQGRTPPVGPAPGYRAEDQIRLTAPQAVVWDVRTYDDPDQARGTTFRGLVTGPDGLPVEDALVRLGQAQTVTDAQGRFSFQGHRMTEYERAARRVFLTAEKGGERALAYPTPEQTWTTLPIRLAPSPTTMLTGIAVDTQGRPLAGVPLQCDGWLRDSPVPAPVAPSVTDVNGRFEISGLYPDAGYQVTLGGRLHDGTDSVYGATFLPALPRPEWNLLGGYGRALTLTPGDHQDLGRIVMLRADRTIAGRIVDRQGHPVTSEVEVSVTGLHTNSLSHTDAEGRFHAGHLAREPLILSAYAPEIGPGTSRGWSSGPDSPDLIGQAPVSARAQTVRLTVDPRPAPPPLPPPSPPQPTILPPLPVTLVQETLPFSPGRGLVRDQVQALRVARRFLDAVGWTGNLTTQRYPPRFFPGSAPSWGVQIHSDTSDMSIPEGGLSIAADTGEITSMFSYAPNAPGNVSDPRLTQAQVLARARSVFQAAGITREYDTQGISTTGAECLVSLRPLFHGIPTQLMGFGQMQLDAHTGRLRALMLPEAWATDPPSALPAVDRVHALRAATAVWAKTFPSESPDVYAQLWVVPGPPTRRPRPPRDARSGAPTYSPPVGRLVWIVRDKSTGISAHEVWVDAQTGSASVSP